VNRLEALALVDELLARQIALDSLAAEHASKAVMVIAVRERDAARFRVAAAIAPDPVALRVTRGTPAPAGETLP
jgi:hypothetical protein